MPFPASHTHNPPSHPVYTWFGTTDHLQILRWPYARSQKLCISLLVRHLRGRLGAVWLRFAWRGWKPRTGREQSKGRQDSGVPPGLVPTPALLAAKRGAKGQQPPCPCCRQQPPCPAAPAAHSGEREGGVGRRGHKKSRRQGPDAHVESAAKVGQQRGLSPPVDPHPPLAVVSTTASQSP